MSKKKPSKDFGHTYGHRTCSLFLVSIVSSLVLIQSSVALIPSGLSTIPIPPIPLALASITHPVTVPAPHHSHHGSNSMATAASSISATKVPPPMNANDVIGYIVVPYPGGLGSTGNSNQRADLQSSIFSMLSPFGALGGLGRNYRTLRSAYTPSLATSASTLSPMFMNPLAANPMAAYTQQLYGSGFGSGYPSLYGYNTRMPFFGLFG